MRCESKTSRDTGRRNGEEGLAQAEHVLVLEEWNDAKAQPDAVRADTILHPGGDLTFEQDQIGEEGADRQAENRPRAAASYLPALARHVQCGNATTRSRPSTSN